MDTKGITPSVNFPSEWFQFNQDDSSPFTNATTRDDGQINGNRIFNNFNNDMNDILEYMEELSPPPPTSPLSPVENTIEYRETSNTTVLMGGPTSLSIDIPSQPTTSCSTSLSSTTEYSSSAPTTPSDQPCPTLICFEPGCGKSYKTRDHLRRHQRRCHGNSRKEFLCRICHKPNVSGSHRNRHERLHMSPEEAQKQGSFWKQCSICSKVFCDKKLFERHDAVHTNGKMFSCNYCDKRYKFDCSLARHLKRCHTSLGSSVCMLPTTTTSS